MDIYAPLCRNVVTPLWSIKEKSPYFKHFRDLKKNQYATLEKLEKNQLIKLQALLKHAYKNTEYYRSLWQNIGFHPNDLKKHDILEQLPILTKEDIRANKEKMVASNLVKKKLVPRKTSGSTGVSLEFFVDDDCQQWKRACTLLRDHWSGWNLGEKIAAIWGNPQYMKSWRTRLRNTFLERYDCLDTLNMAEEQMYSFYHRQLKRKPSLLFGHAHSIYLFANFLEQKKMAAFKLKGIISSSMVLHDFERQKIEDVFDCKVTNRYGCEEVSLIASECEQHSGMHLNSDSLVVEFIRDGNKVPAGVQGKIVVTDIVNFGMPFIRYKVGDVGIPSDQRCSCGRSYPLMEKVEGRIADYIVTPEGNFISGISLTENFALLLPEVKQLQIIQEEIDFLIFKVVKGVNFKLSSEKKLKRLVIERFGEGMRHDVEYVDHISQEASGKYRFCISKVINPFF